MTGLGPVFIRFDFLEFFMKVPLKKNKIILFELNKMLYLNEQTLKRGRVSEHKHYEYFCYFFS
jgi:hypothetical protein